MYTDIISLQKNENQHIIRVCIRSTSFLFYLESFNLESPSTKTNQKNLYFTDASEFSKDYSLTHTATYQNFSDNRQLFSSSLSLKPHSISVPLGVKSETNKSLPSFHSNRKTIQKHSECNNSCLVLISNSSEILLYLNSMPMI